ncbi:hypothetical protein H920_11355 [Fukomys damarensis]|uniref:Uncharacterized protein n=1 Tax=Fukomys damarensis TaxID=885580 RepID=A0A091DWT5_FUKDA|nr:hypothetical protein H920_11355 [Fukomys damarensis]
MCTLCDDADETPIGAVRSLCPTPHPGGVGDPRIADLRRPRRPRGRALISSTQILLPIPFGMLCDTYEWMRLLFKGAVYDGTVEEVENYQFFVIQFAWGEHLCTSSTVQGTAENVSITRHP